MELLVLVGKLINYERRVCQAYFLVGISPHCRMTEHVTDLSCYSPITDVMGDLSMSGDLSNNVNWYPCLNL